MSNIIVFKRPCPAFFFRAPHSTRISVLISVIVLLSTPSSVFADEEAIYKVVPSLPVYDVAQDPLAKLPFNSAKFDLAYQSFIYNGHVQSAYALSFGAVKQRPGSVLWRKRLVQTAIWSGHPETALDGLTYLIKEKNEKALLPQAIKLAEQLQQYQALVPLLEIELRNHPGHAETISKLAKAYDMLGETRQSIQLLQNAHQSRPHQLFLAQLANLYRDTGSFQQELLIRQEIQKRYGNNAQNALAIAQIYAEQARPQQALKALEEVSHQQTILDKAFWKTAGQLSWQLGQDKTGRQAYLQLYQLNALAPEEYRRLFALQPKNAAKETLQIALSGFQQYHDAFTFLTALALAEDLQAWETLAKLYQSALSPATRLQLEKETAYWSGKAVLLQYLGRPQYARAWLLEATLANPQVMALAALYLNFIEYQLTLVLPDQQPPLLPQAMAYWQHQACLSQSLAAAYVKSLLLLDRPAKALQLYACRGPFHATEVDWNVRYAEALTELGSKKSAFLSREAYFLWMMQQAENHDEGDIDFWNAFVELADIFRPATIAFPLASHQAEHAHNVQGVDALLSLAIAHDQYELAAYLLAYYYSGALPAYPVLKLAMVKNDQTKIAKIIRPMSDVLPRKDRVTAALQIGDLPFAQTLAFDGMKGPVNAARYEEAVAALLKNANEATLLTEFEQYGAYQGPRAKIKAKVYLDNRWHIAPYASIWDGMSNNQGILVGGPYLEKIVGATLSRETDRSGSHLSIDQHSALYNSLTAEIGGKCLWDAGRLKTEGSLGFNRRSTLDVFMLIAGSQDEAKAFATYQLTQHDFLIGSMEWDAYYLQDRTALGSGKLFNGEIQHKLWLEWPDFTLGFIGSINRFCQKNVLVQGRAVRLLPTNSLPTAQTFLTKNYWQGLFYFRFGDAVRDNYIHAPRPYANWEMFYSSTSGYGYSYDLGLASQVFGRDKLSAYYTRSTSSNGQAQSNFLLGLSYQIYL